MRRKGSQQRPSAEKLESRLLLSNYAINPIGRFGINHTGFGSADVTMDSAGNLYGLAAGGLYGYGAAFELAKGSNTITPLASFRSSTYNPSPAPLAIDADGNLFGATFNGGSAGLGGLFEIAKGSGVVTTIYSFAGGIIAPMGGVLLDPAGDIFGATEIGGPANKGVVFELRKGSQSLTILASATSATGYFTGGLAFDAAGNLYGTANDAIFEIAKGSGPFTTLATVAPRDTVASLSIDANQNVYGDFAFTAASQNGSIFEIPAGGVLTTLATFTGSNGTNPGPLTMDGNGNLFGATLEGGDSGLGTVFELPKGSGAITALASFTYRADDDRKLVVDGNENLFGAADGGGTASDGSVFELASGSGMPQTLASFDANNGFLYHKDNVVRDANGNIFGTTNSGGTNNYGSVFEIASGSDAVTTLASFNGANGEYPFGLALGADGNLYGATEIGGSHGYGTLFEVAQGSNSVTTLFSMSNTTGLCTSGLISDANGNLYGVFGSDTWSVFEIPLGSTTPMTLATSNSASGTYPSGPINMDSEGNLYGMTSAGGTNGDGTIFELVAGTNTISALASFTGQIYSNGGMVVDADGNIYGTTTYGGTSGEGSVFEVVNGSGQVSTVASFDVFNTGYNPVGNLIVDSNGDLFGVAEDGGALEEGSVFEIARGTGVITDVVTFNDVGPDLPQALLMDGAGDFFCATPGMVAELTPAAASITLRQDVDQKQIDWTIGTNSGKTLIDDPLGLNIVGDGNNDTISLDYSAGDPLPNTLHLIGTFTINGLQGTNPLAGTTLDIVRSTVFLSYANAASDPIAAITGYLQSGYNNGDWDGGGIVSSAAAVSASHATTIGYADWADGLGVNTVPNTIELKYTLYGDANLDGQVNSADLQILLFGLNRPGAWDQGDFNYDGQVNSADLQELLFTLNTSLGNQVAVAAVNAGAGVQGTAVQSKLGRAGAAPLVHVIAATPPVANQHEMHQTRPKRRQ